MNTIEVTIIYRIKIDMLECMNEWDITARNEENVRGGRGMALAYAIF